MARDTGWVWAPQHLVTLSSWGHSPWAGSMEAKGSETVPPSGWTQAENSQPVVLHKVLTLRAQAWWR
jgi:hypothetical protein